MSEGIHATPAMARQDWISLIILSVFWGGSFFFNEVAVRELPTLTIVVSRVFLASCFLLFAIRFLKLRLPGNCRLWGLFLVMGLLNNVIPFCLIVWAQSSLASGQASILNATTPLFTVVVAHWLAYEKMTGERMFGVIAGLFGVAVMMGGDVIHSLGGNVMASIACLAAAFSYACAAIYGRRFGRMGISPVITAMGQLSASSVVLVPAMLVIDQPWMLTVPTMATAASLLGLAFFSTAMAYILYFRILARAGATNLLFVTFLVPVSALILGILTLGETFSAEQAAGLAMIGLGLTAVGSRRNVFPRRIENAELSMRKPPSCGH